jgi:site-specific DNA recombinase
VGRVSATEIEGAILAALSVQPGQGPKGFNGVLDTIERIERVIVARDQLLINLTRSSDDKEMDGAVSEIRIPWPTKVRDSTVAMESDGETEGTHNEGLVQSVVRAHAWMQSLRHGMFESVEMLAEANRLHPKVIRQALRLAFLSPNVTSAILAGSQPAALSLAQIPKLLPLPWTEHRRLLG